MEQLESNPFKDKPNERNPQKNKILDYGSIIYLNYLDLNGEIYYAYSDGLKSSCIDFQQETEFFGSNKLEWGK